MDYWKYSQTIASQSNPNLTVTRNNWSNLNNAVGKDPSTDFGSSKFKRKGKKGKYTYVVPHVLTVHDFRLTADDIPSNAYIKGVTIQVRMRVDSKKIKVKAPVGHFMIYGGKGSVNQQSTKGKTGWYGSTYRVYPSTQLSTSYKTIEYTISGTQWNKMAYPTTQLHKAVMGIDLNFQDPSSMTDTPIGVEIRWARIKVDYDLPNYSLTYNKVTDGNNPVELDVGGLDCVTATLSNTTRANGGTQSVNIQLPFGARLISHTPSSNSSFSVVDNYNGQYLWTCDGSGLAKNTLKLCIEYNSFGLKSLVSTLNNAEYPYYVYPYADSDIDYGNVLVIPGTVQENAKSCFKFYAKCLSADGTVSFQVTVDGDGLTNWNNVSDTLKEYYNNNNNGNNLLDTWSLDDSSAVQGVSIDYSNSNNNVVTFNVPEDTEVDIIWTGCFVPFFNGNNHIVVRDQDTNTDFQFAYNSLAPDDLFFDIDFGDLYWADHRILFEVNTNGYIIPIGFTPTDKVHMEGACTLTAFVWEDLAYIGCVPIGRSHYEPEHDFTNKGLSKTFKNKVYKGKSMEYEEDTSLKIRLPPRDWTTLQGLTKIDKPIPVNTVPTAFEGDVLNHRGWAEITGIKGITKTNPLYYDGEIELDYITHDINTRFKIERGNDSNSAQIPDLVTTVVEHGDEFAVYTRIDDEGDTVSADGFFVVDTDGSYVYDEEAEENLRTLVALDNEQYVTITSDDYLREVSYITMDWSSTKIDEDKENNISREVVLLSDKDTPVFKYTYFDYEFDTNDDYYTCYVKAELLDNGVWTEIINQKLYLDSDIESLQLTVDSNGNVVQEDEDSIVGESTDSEDTDVYSFNDYVYGSSLSLNLKGNLLSVSDTGYNGKSVSQDNIELPDGKYKLQVNFVNHNTDGDTTDVISFFDFEVVESVIDSDFRNDYANMYISSFPLKDSELMFTRIGEEGTIYYFKNEASSVTYIQEPFYMYFGGVDLTNKVGSSIFDLDNSYTVFYLTNGLVRLGFNRLNGDLYLSKFDPHSNEYVNVADLHCTNTDFSVGAFSDDKIEIKAGTTVYTMYRGHPYVVIKHPDEDITFDTIWSRVWAESINNEQSDTPIFWDLKNHDNLLPVKIGGTNISKSDLTTTDEEETVTTPTLTLTQLTNPIHNDEMSFWSLSGTVSNVSEDIPLNTSYNSIFGEITWETNIDETIVTDLLFTHITGNPVQDGDTAKLYVEALSVNGVGVANQRIDFYEYYTALLESSSSEVVDEFDTGTVSVKLTDSEDGNLVEGESVTGYVYNPHLFYYEGLGGTETDSWTYNTSTTTITPSETGTVITNTDTTTGRLLTVMLSNESSYYCFLNDLVMEFDIVSIDTNSIKLSFVDGTDDTNRYNTSYLVTGHYKIVYEDNVVYCYKDDVLLTQTSWSSEGLFTIRFGLNKSSTFTIKNVVIGGY